MSRTSGDNDGFAQFWLLCWFAKKIYWKIVDAGTFSEDSEKRRSYDAFYKIYRLINKKKLSFPEKKYLFVVFIQKATIILGIGLFLETFLVTFFSS